MGHAHAREQKSKFATDIPPTLIFRLDSIGLQQNVKGAAMMKILKFFGPKTKEAKMVTQRQRFEAACAELNDVLGELDKMPVVQIDAAARQITITAPEQFADEALALPKPDDTPPSKAETNIEKDADEDEKKSAA